MFPATWNSTMHSTGKKRGRSGERKTSTKEHDGINPTDNVVKSGHSRFVDDFDVCQRILCSVNSTQGRETEKIAAAEISLDSLLSNMPYRAILSNMAGNAQPHVQDVPLIAKAYEESMMREPYASERPCASGPLCECMFIDKTAPFVGTEFLLPGETPHEHPQLCVLCTRKVTQKLFYDLLLKEPLGFPNTLIQRYGNLCGIPGEYARECMLICPPDRALECMPQPCMSHQRNRYEVCVSNNMKFLRQVNVSFQDFQPPSISAQT